jgi:hypothetical protein
VAFHWQDIEQVPRLYSRVVQRLNVRPEEDLLFPVEGAEIDAFLTSCGCRVMNDRVLMHLTIACRRSRCGFCTVTDEQEGDMTMWGQVGRLVKGGLVLGLAVGMAGCDYWPPALQTQIEQLRSEVQAVTAEKTQLQNQVASLTKVKDDLQAQVDDLSRASRDKTAMINSLQNSVAALQERLTKSAKTAATKAGSAKTAAKTAPKPATKTTQKAPVKKKPVAKSVVVR